MKVVIFKCHEHEHIRNLFNQEKHFNRKKSPYSSHDKNVPVVKLILRQKKFI